MVLLAIFVSRFEASIVTAMLRGYGLHVSLDGEEHASVAYNSLALGGHRLRVFEADYEVASEILRAGEIGADEYEAPGPTRALLWAVGALAAFYLFTVGFGVLVGASHASSLLYIPLGIYSIPVDPKGKPDYFLAPGAS